MTIDELTKFLNERANGMRCPICKSTDWYLKVDDGVVRETNVATGYRLDLQAALGELITEFGGQQPKESTDQQAGKDEQDLLSSCIILRCNHCGRLESFDRSFIEEQIHGKN